MNKVSGLMSQEDQNIFSKIDRQYELEYALRNNFPEFSMVEELDELLETMQMAKEDLISLLSPDRPKQWKDGDSLRDRKRIRYTVFAIASIHLSIEEYYYAKFKKYKNSTVATSSMDIWKQSPEVLAVKCLRNRIQHKPMMSGVFKVDWENDETHTGKYKLQFHLDNSDIGEGAIKMPEERRQLVLNYLDDLRRGENFIVDLLSNYLYKTFDFLNELRKIYALEFQTESEKRNIVVTELEEIENWFGEKGLARVSI